MHMYQRFGLIAALLAAILASASQSPSAAHAAITAKGQQGCEPGTVVGGSNLIYNGDFSLGSVGFESDLPDRTQNIYPSDPVGGFSIQTGDVSYYDNKIVGRVFPGDVQRDVGPSNTYFYSNPNQDKLGNPGPFKGVLWRQTVSNLAPSTTYNFFAYFDNLQIPTDGGTDPQIELRVDGIAAGPAIVVPKTPDAWVPIQYLFSTGPGQTSAVLEVYDLAYDIRGDDFGMTQLGLKQCVSGIGVAKFATLPVNNNDGSYNIEFLLTVRHMGGDALPLTNVQINDDLTKTFAGAASFSVVSLTSATLVVNPNYNGSTDTALLAPGNSLPSRVNQQLRLVVKVVAGSGPTGKGPFYNSAVASATAASVGIQDLSSWGIDPDPNGNGAANESSEDVPTAVWLDPTVVFLPLIAN